MTDPNDQTNPPEQKEAPEADQKPARPRRSRPRTEPPASPPAADLAAPAAAPPPQVPPPPGGARPPAPPADAAPPRPSFGQRVRKGVRRLLSWLLVAAFGLLLGVLIFIAFPPLFDRVVRPLTENAANVAQLQRQVGALETRLAEMQMAQTRAAVEQQGALVEAQDTVAARLAAAEGRLADAEARLRAAEDRLADGESRIDELEALLDETVGQVEAVSGQLEALEAELPGSAEYAAYNRQLLLIRAWQDVLKARLRLMQNNAGLALDDLALALETLDRVYEVSTADEQAALDPIIERLRAAQTAITASPFTASSDLEVGWYDLGRLIEPVGGPPSAPADEETPTP